GGSGNDLLEAGAGPAVLDGGDDIDTVSYQLASAGVTVDLADLSLNTGLAAGHSYSGIEKFDLSAYNDVFIGTDASTVVYGGGGNDVLSGGNAPNWLDGGDGNDILNAGDGNDALVGGIGNDTLNGGAGADYLSGGAGADLMSGGGGFDTASYRDAAAAVSIDLVKDSSTWTGDAQGDVLTSIEQIILTAFDDTFRGDANANIVFGFEGNDQIFGGDGNDSLNGNAGNDIIQGGDGNDIVRGDDHDGIAGDDYLQGNAGDD